MARPAISVCLTTARPYAWRRAYDAWRNLSRAPDRVEFVLFFAEHYGFDRSLHIEGNPVVVWSGGRTTSISGWNAAAKASTGKFLILAHDDITPPRNWDADLLKTLPTLNDEYVTLFETSPPEAERKDFELAALTRARYEKLGYAFFPEYEGESATDEFYVHAEMDAVIEPPPDIVFAHYHPKYGDGLWDERYQERHSEQRRLQGRGLYQARERMGFPAPGTPDEFNLRESETCNPSEDFLEAAGLGSD